MNHTRGFTLIELSIVLIIIGLIVGGVLLGRDLIRGSEMQAVISETEMLLSGTQNFKTKYKALPGDMPNATSFWGIQAGATGNDDVCYLSVSTSVATCNGNGDEMITGGYTNTGLHEPGRYFQHLANAGMIRGQYTGVRGLYATETRYAGVNVMKSTIPGAHYNVIQAAPPAASTLSFEHPMQHILETTGNKTLAASATRYLMTPAELLIVDTKIDDGKPAFGMIRGAKFGSAFAPNCTTTTDPATAEYATTLPGKECYLYVLTGF
jgi:prepilin-type N-terminal cleavage/methylation domain-containing protein